jgi:hypothetical protein
MTKRDLRRQVTVLRDQLWEMETRMRALELRLSEHLRDSERHATPAVHMPSIGDGLHNQRIHDGQVHSHMEPQRMWDDSAFVRGWSEEDPT